MPKQPIPHAEHDPIGLERLVFFSDAVYAIAITLLVLDIRLPVDVGNLTDPALLSALGSIWQKYLAYILSFLVIGTFWMAHLRKFRYIVRYDRTLLLLNILLLMVVAFIPFPTSILSENPGSTATIFYALTIAVGGLFSILVWTHAIRGGLVEKNLPMQVRRRESLRGLTTPILFLVSAGVATLNPDLARLFWTLLFPILLLIR